MDGFQFKITYLYFACAVIGAYVLGSIPTSVWIGKWFYNIDVREHGSKNAGATNTIRVIGAKAGIPAFLIDVLKGFGAVSLIYFFKRFEKNTDQFVLFQITLGVSAIVGHIFPFLAQFRGGKGVATTLGIVLAIAVWPSLIAFGIFVLIVTFTRYVSLGSMTAAISFPLMILFIFKCDQLALIIFSAIIALLIIATHRKNINRLLKGEENKFSFRKKASS